MDRLQIEALLNEVRSGSASVPEALERLRNLPFEDLGFAKLDHHRALRTGMPEVIFSESKTPAQVAAIFERMAKAGGNVLATRASREVFEAVHGAEPRAEFHEAARAITLMQTEAPAGKGTVGVAGIHRLLAQQKTLQSARVLVVCAGMEGALPTVVGGLVNAPVIAVPTSVGYGASLGGVAALLGMLNTCAPNVSVVNIDNGFGAACIASLINHL